MDRPVLTNRGLETKPVQYDKPSLIPKELKLEPVKSKIEPVKVLDTPKYSLDLGKYMTLSNLFNVIFFVVLCMIFAWLFGLYSERKNEKITKIEELGVHPLIPSSNESDPVPESYLNLKVDEYTLL